MKKKKKRINYKDKIINILTVVFLLCIVLIIATITGKKDYYNKINQCMKKYSEEYCYAIVR